jgi:polyhydroxybutyrate depolymerase
MSNGAMMTHRIGLELSDRIAAIAPVVGGLFGDEAAPPNGVAAMIVNGRLDRSVPVEGGLGEGRFPDAWDGTPLMPAVYQASFWAAANGCAPEAPEMIDDPVYELTVYACPEGTAVEYYLIREGGHAWPGGLGGTRLGDVPVVDFDATDAMWAFFQRHSLSSRPGAELRRRTP